MLYDVRTYTAKPGSLKKQLKLYEEFGLSVQCRYLGKPFAFMVTETGNINRYVHIWRYVDNQDRDDRRSKLMQDPEWQQYSKKVSETGYLISQENTLMKDAPFIS